MAARGALWTPWAAVAAILLLLGLVYPYAGSYARTGGFANAPTLDGLKWLRGALTGRPGRDRLAARRTRAGDAVVLEAFGDDYSAFGHGRISTFTGRPTVMGWAGPRAAVAARPRLARRRRPDALHDAPTSRPAQALIDRYGIDYVVVGPIEQTTYGDAGLAKWDQLGERVYSARRHHGLAALAPAFLM